LYYGPNNPIPGVANAEKSGINIFVQAQNGTIYKSADYPPERGYNDVISQPSTANLADSMIAKNADKSLPIFPRLMDVYENSAPGGKYDFKFYPERSTPCSLCFDYRNMYVVDGVARQYDYPANLVWGAVVESKGIPLWGALAGSAFQAGRDENRPEDSRDFGAITRGYNWQSPSNPTNFSTPLLTSKDWGMGLSTGPFMPQTDPFGPLF
jgi:hypothetical protein